MELKKNFRAKSCSDIVKWYIELEIVCARKLLECLLVTGICILCSDLYRLMLLEEEHADPEALAEILLETCKSITYSLGEW